MRTLIDAIRYAGPIRRLLKIPSVVAHSAVRVTLVEPAATFTSVTPSSAAAGADTLLTSAGVHGLTGAVSVGASIYISAGTGWTVGFHTITAIAVDSTGTTIQIDTPYSASMGTPTIALANTEVTLATIAIPPLRDNSFIELDLTHSYTNSANNKSLIIKLNTTTLNTAVLTTTVSDRMLYVISNRNSTSSQLGCVGNNTQGGTGANTGSVSTASENTSIASSLVLSATPAAANNLIALERHIVRVLL